MKNASYRLLASGSGRKLEDVGGLRMVRPAAGAVWESYGLPVKTLEYIRFKDSSGEWRFGDRQPKAPLVSFNIEHQIDLQVQTRLTSFGHLGFFAEQAQNWRRIYDLCVQITRERKSCKVLNLFAYTGIATMAAAKSGAQVTHVDASKTTVAWGRDLAELNGLIDAPIRWIVDDVSKFVAREVRRGNTYDGVILDPPSFGRGTKSEVWKIESDLAPLMGLVYELVKPSFGFVLLSAHSQGYTPQALQNIQMQNLQKSNLKDVKLIPEEMLIPAEDGRDLPSGACCWALNSKFTL